MNYEERDLYGMYKVRRVGVWRVPRARSRTDGREHTHLQ